MKSLTRVWISAVRSGKSRISTFESKGNVSLPAMGPARCRFSWGVVFLNCKAVLLVLLIIHFFKPNPLVLFPRVTHQNTSSAVSA